MAPRDVVSGTLYADSIVRAINESRIVVLILSEDAIASAHVGKELERAASKRHPIIVMRIDAAPLTPAFEYFLSESQWIEAGRDGTDPAIAKLIRAVCEHLVAKSAGAAGSSIAAGVALALGVAYLWMARPWSHAHSTAAGNSPTAGISSAAGDKSIAVLPFTDMSEKKDQEYFADGMAKEILDVLVKIPGLKVIGRTSSFQFKGQNVDLRTIGTQVGARYATLLHSDRSQSA